MTADIAGIKQSDFDRNARRIELAIEAAKIFDMPKGEAFNLVDLELRRRGDPSDRPLSEKPATDEAIKNESDERPPTKVVTAEQLLEYVDFLKGRLMANITEYSFRLWPTEAEFGQMVKEWYNELYEIARMLEHFGIDVDPNILPTSDPESTDA